MSIVVALVACFLTAFCATSKRKNLTLIPFVIGMVGAYLFACVLTGIGYLSNLNWLKIIVLQSDTIWELVKEGLSSKLILFMIL